MNRLSLLFLLFIISSKPCYPQAYQWAWARGGVTNNHVPLAEGWQAATDNSENIYVCGYYYSNVSFGPDTLRDSFVGSFLVKYDANGNIKWAKGDSSVSAFDDGTRAYGVCIDAHGNIYVSGQFNDTVYFGSYRLTGGSSNTFLVKYDSLGNVLWAKSSVDAYNFGDYSNSVAVDRSGNVYIAGYYNSSVTFGPFTLTDIGTMGSVYLVKYDSSGNVLWANSSQSQESFDEGYAVTTDIKGNIYITGTFEDSISFGTQTLLNPDSEANCIFLVKYDSLGNVIRAVTQSGGIGQEIGYSVACDLSGNIYVAGSIGIGFWDSGFITKYDTSENILWSKNVTSNKAGYGIGCYEVTTDKSANVYVTGGFLSTTAVDVGGDTTLYPPPASTDPMFIVKYDSSGRLLYATALTSGGDDQCGIAVTKSGAIYLGGDYYYANTFILGNDTLTSPNDGQGEQVFVAKLTYNSNANTGVISYSSDNVVSIYPNPTTDILLVNANWKSGTGIKKISVYNVMGQIIYNDEATDSLISINCNSFAAGIYFVQVKNESETWVGKFVKE